MLLSFLYGLMVSFSPCSLPLIPIIMRMCGTTNKALLYLLGSTISYVILGFAIVSVGIYFSDFMHSLYVKIFFSLLLGYLALSCFNIVRLPQTYFQSSNVFILGVLSPIILSPCMTPALGNIMLKMLSDGVSVSSIAELSLFGVGVTTPMVLSLLGLNKVIQHRRVKVIMPYITKLNGLLIIGAIAYLWL